MRVDLVRRSVAFKTSIFGYNCGKNIIIITYAARMHRDQLHHSNRHMHTAESTAPSGPYNISTYSAVCFIRNECGRIFHHDVVFSECIFFLFLIRLKSRFILFLNNEFKLNTKMCNNVLISYKECKIVNM